MNFTNETFVGIDPTSGNKSFTYAALDKELNLITLADGEMEEVLALLAGCTSAVVAINSPAALNNGLVRRKLQKEMDKAHKVRGAEFRVAEYELREHGIVVSGTAASMGLCPAWMQLGFELYRELEIMGFMKYPQETGPYQVMETHPHACYCVMAGKVPLSKPSLEGKLQRQLLLYEHGVRVKDPMGFFEEITRHKITKGIWPSQMLYLPEQLDALVAAYTAWVAVNKREQIVIVGDSREGLMILPSGEFKDMY